MPPSTTPERRPWTNSTASPSTSPPGGRPWPNVDLSVACLFEREADGASSAGGLLQLDRAPGGRLTDLRARGAFRAQEMETLLITLPPPRLDAAAFARHSAP